MEETRQRKRILHVITGLGTGGAEMVLCKLLTGLAGVGSAHFPREKQASAPEDLVFDSMVVALRGKGGPLSNRIANLGVSVVELRLEAPSQWFAALKKLFHLIRKSRPDCIQGWMYHGNLVATLLASAWRMAGSSPPLLWSVHATLEGFRATKRSTSMLIRCGAWLSRWPVYIRYASYRSALEHEAAGYRRSATLIIPNGFDTEEFSPNAASRERLRSSQGFATDTPLIGLVARYHPMKDHAGFIQAAAMVCESGRNRSLPGFVLMGSGVEQSNMELVSLIRSTGWSGRFRLLGDCRETASVMAGIDVLCVSSRYGEAFPNVIGEAMACGVPCVTTDVGDAAIIVGTTGRVVPPGDPEALARSLNEILEMDAQDRAELGRKARARIVQEYPVQRMVREYRALYSRVFGKPRENNGS